MSIGHMSVHWIQWTTQMSIGHVHVQWIQWTYRMSIGYLTVYIESNGLNRTL